MVALKYQPAHHIWDIQDSSKPPGDLKPEATPLTKQAVPDNSVSSPRTLGTHKALLGEESSLITVMLRLKTNAEPFPNGSKNSTMAKTDDLTSNRSIISSNFLLTLIIDKSPL